MNRFSISLKLVVFLLFLLFTFLVYLLFKRYSFVNNRLYKISNPKVITSAPVPTPQYTLPNWNKINIKWSSANHPIASNFKKTFTIEFVKELCERENYPVCGFDEFHGTYEDVNNAVKFLLENLQNQIEVNMDYLEDGSFKTYDTDIRLKESFNPKVPVRFIYFDGDKFKFPLANISYSRGWGINPKTNGLEVYLVLTTQQVKDWEIIGADGLIFESMLLMAKISDGRRIQDNNKYSTMLELWYAGDEKKTGIKPGDVATLKPILITYNP